MATVKFLNAAGKYDDPASRDDVIRYITQKHKTPSGYIGACGVDVPYAAQQMQEVSASFKKDNKIRIRHFVVSFYRNEQISPYKANMIASMIALELGRIYQCVYAVHEDTYNIHVHFVFNPNAPLGKGGCTLQGFKVVLVARRLAPITLSRTLWGMG